ncbi:hypothetical protein WH47_08723 [Habropoda laboriosa]|uniref:Uncharacterized protein n=1 Tax=Habropoda laboriosa TaxID=597456 RepID=A0A0L7QPF1_9HYME|nr:hypothetical protein WH47_08723 [Habropoda laboriosa]
MAVTVLMACQILSNLQFGPPRQNFGNPCALHARICIIYRNTEAMLNNNITR